MQHPVLYLGLMGFDAASELAVRRWVAGNAAHARKDSEPEATDHPVWQVVDFSEADALLIRGEGVSQGFGSSLQFKSISSNPSFPSTALGVQLDGIKLPFALSDIGHLQSLGVDAKNHPVFDPHSAVSMMQTVRHFENMLRPLRTLYALAMELTARHEELDALHTFHLERNGGLDAVIDPPNRRVFLRSGLRPVDIESDTWLRRPKSANFAPAHFMECNMEELAWVFAMHCGALDLPKRYAAKPIHMRRNPRVRASLLYPRHAQLLDVMWQNPSTLQDLQKRLSASAHWIERDLFALYLTRSISTSAPAKQPGDHSTQPPSEFDNTGKWILHRMSRRMNTMNGELGPLY
jgi:hypothetical protein